MAEEEQQRLLQLLYLLPMGVVEFGDDGVVGLVNPLMVQMFLPLVGPQALSDAYALLRPLVPDLPTRLAESTTTGPIVSGQRRLLDPQGQAVVAEVHVHRIADRFVALVLDITAQAEAQRKLRQEEQRYSAILRAVRGYGICSIDAEGTVDSWNEMAAEMFGTSEGLGRALDDIVPIAPSLRRVLEATAVTGWQKVTAELAEPGGTRWLEVLISRLEGDEQEAPPSGYVVVSRDRTEDMLHAQQLEHAASTDPLTSLANRRGFDARVAQLTAAVEPPHAVCMVDLDHFKSVNDTHGHDAGDAVLVAVSGALRRAVRASDLPARFGGEEFAIFLPGTDVQGAFEVAERIRVAIEALRIPLTEDVVLRVTASIGVCTEQLPMDEALAAADAALYRAKESGRNRVCA